MNDDGSYHHPRCQVCQSVMIPETYYCDGYVEYRWHCINACRGADKWIVYRQPWLPKIERRFTFHRGSSRKGINSRKSLRVITCMCCGKTVEMMAYSNTKCCSVECRNELRSKWWLKHWETVKAEKKEGSNVVLA